MQQVKAGSRPPWVGLAAAVWVQVAGGSSYAFALYSPTIKSVLGYSQQQLTMLGVANDIGENFGLLAGFASCQFQPWVLLLAGAAFCFVGFGVVWLAVSQTVVGVPFWILWIALCIGANSSAWFITGVLVTNMRNFPVSRGTVSGILKSYVGLSASVFTGLYTGPLHSSSTNLLLFFAIGLPVVCIAMMSLVRPCTPSLEEDSSERCHFLFTQISAFLLGLYVLGFTIVNNYATLGEEVTSLLFGIMVLLLLAPLAIPIKMTFFRTKPKSHNTGEAIFAEEKATKPLLDTSSSSNSLLNLRESEDVCEVDMLLAVGEGAVKKKRRPRRGDDFEFHEALVKADFWLLFLTFFIGVGSGVTFLNNLAQIGIAAGVDDPTILLCLFSFANFLGRLGGGAITEHFVRTRMLPRPIWIAFSQIIMIIVYLLFALGQRIVLVASTPVLGLCFGFHSAVMVPTVSELFGLKHFGSFFNFILLGNPLGALLFSGLLAGHLYDAEAAKQHPGFLPHSSVTCLGPNCFRLTFLILAGLCSLGSFLSVILTVRIRPVYQMLYAGGSFSHPRASISVHGSN